MQLCAPCNTPATPPNFDNALMELSQLACNQQQHEATLGANPFALKQQSAGERGSGTHAAHNNNNMHQNTTGTRTDHSQHFAQQHTTHTHRQHKMARHADGALSHHDRQAHCSCVMLNR